MEYLGDFTSPRGTRTGSYLQDAQTGHDVFSTESHGIATGQSAWNTSSAVLDLIEALDDVLSGVLDGQLNVNQLTRCGFLQSVPSATVLWAALADGLSPQPQAAFWPSFQSASVNAWVFLTSSSCGWSRNQTPVFEPQSSVDIARLLVNSRDLRGRGPAEQHARLTIRSLQADLRRMCPSTRGAYSGFQTGVYLGRWS